MGDSTKDFVEAMATQDVVGIEEAAALVAEKTRPRGPTTREIAVIVEKDSKRREDDALARVRRAGREAALWEVVSMLNRAVTECRAKGQQTAQLEEVRAAVRKMAGG
jgi:hypothetical protein